MKVSVLSLFPDLYSPFLKTSLIKHAQEAGYVAVNLSTLFSYVEPKERVDAPTFGPGAGMVIRPDVIERGVEDTEKKHGRAYRIFFSPQGTKLTQPLLHGIKQNIEKHNNHCLIVAARYEGIDARAQEVYADIVLSVGDFVVMGGDLPAMLFIEGLFRLIPGIVGKEESVTYDSFTHAFIDWPAYCPPVEWHGKRVPDIVRSGNHAAIAEWRRDKAAKKTVFHHFEWLRSHILAKKDRQHALQFIPPHYTALLHANVNLPNGRVGTTSVTSFDIHDIACSSRTYGMRNYFVVTPLQDQQEIVNAEITYDEKLHKAVQIVRVVDTLDAVIQAIEDQEGEKPLIIATSVYPIKRGKQVTFYDQERVWIHNRPVLFIFGAAQGLSAAIIDRCDYVLLPLGGFPDFNHLSVRSVVAIVLDRWIGINVRRRYTEGGV